MILLQKLLSLLLCFAVVGCVSFFREEAEPIRYPDQLVKVENMIRGKQQKQALRELEQYLSSAENIQWHGQAYYLKARVEQGMGDIGRSSKSYRAAIAASQGLDRVVQAQSLYGVSWLYEEGGQFPQMVASLLDLLKFRDLLDTVTVEIEIPARLAAAYARLGNFSQAHEFHQSAELQMIKLMRQRKGLIKGEIQDRLHFYLGLAVFSPENERFDQLLWKLSLGQSHFLKGAEGSTDWSTKSEKMLISQYSRLWALMVGAPYAEEMSGDPEAQKKNRQEEQLQQASAFYDLLLRFEQEENPGVKNVPSHGLIGHVTTLKDRLEKFVKGLKLGPELLRSKKIPNRPLLKVPEPKAVPAVIYEGAMDAPAVEKDQPKPAKPSGPTLPEKIESIGEDPNL